jgi:hypothetical protein
MALAQTSLAVQRDAWLSPFDLGQIFDEAMPASLQHAPMTANTSKGWVCRPATG